MSYKKIFVPIDDSQVSDLALEEAIKMAELNHAELYLVRVVDFAETDWGTGAKVQAKGNLELITERTDTTEEAFKRSRERLETTGIPYEEAIVGTLGESIPDTLAKKIKDSGCDLVVIGTHTRSGLEDFFISSVTKSVLKQSNVPMLTIRATKD